MGAPAPKRMIQKTWCEWAFRCLYEAEPQAVTTHWTLRFKTIHTYSWGWDGDNSQKDVWWGGFFLELLLWRCNIFKFYSFLSEYFCFKYFGVLMLSYICSLVSFIWVVQFYVCPVFSLWNSFKLKIYRMFDDFFCFCDFLTI